MPRVSDTKSIYQRSLESSGENRINVYKRVLCLLGYSLDVLGGKEKRSQNQTEKGRATEHRPAEVMFELKLDIQ